MSRETIIFQLLSIAGSVASLAAIALAIHFYRIQKRDQERMAEQLGDALGNKTAHILNQVSEHISLTTEQGRRATLLADEVQQILDSVYTKYVGRFPNYLSHVAELIAGAEKSVKVMGLIGSHGEYSECDDRWHKIARAIDDKMHQWRADGKRIEATLLRSEYSCAIEAFRAHHQGLADGDGNWEAWKAKEICDGRLGRFVSIHKEAARDIEEDFSNLDLERYIRLRIDGDRATCGHVYRDFTSIRESQQGLPMYCWIADGKKAIFSIRTEDTMGHYVGAGVTTSDPSLIALLEEMIRYYERRTADEEERAGAPLRLNGAAGAKPVPAS